MKLFKILFFSYIFCVANTAICQTQLPTNCNLNIVTASAGIVNQGNTIDLLITCANTGANPIQPNRIRPSISIPIAIASAAANALQTGLPPGWVISTNTGGVISVCNGTDVIPAGGTREIIIKIQGNAIGGPSFISGNLLFGNGTSCTAFGGSLNGDNPADNSSSTTITIVPSCPLTVSASAGNIACNGGTTIITATTTGAVGAVEYRLDAGPFQSSNIFTVSAGTYTIVARQVDNVNCTALSSPVVISQPAAVGLPLVGSIIQPTCNVAAGSVALNGLPSTGWTINPGNISGSGTSTTISNLSSGTYNFIVTNSAGCSSAPTASVVINAQPSTPAVPIVGTVTQPTCTSPTGSVVLSGLPAGNWVINPGNVSGTGSSSTVGNLSQGTFNFTVTNAGGCSSAATANIIIDAVAGVPAPPIVSVIQPTCTNQNATITVTSATSGLLFSFDSGAYAAYPSGGFFAGEGNHTLSVQTSAGCISANTNIVINAQPSTPVAPTLNIIQPTCTLATGLVTVSSQTSSRIFSVDAAPFEAYPGGGYLLLPGVHTVSTQNQAGCISSNTVFTINQQPETPSVPVVANITQPTCIISSGLVELSGLPLGNWTINPGNITGSGSTVTLTGLADGTYNFTVTNSFGCVSLGAVTVSINPVPGAPSAPTFSIIQPTCNVPNGTLTITSDTTGLLFSLDGGNFLSYPIGGYNLAAGVHTIVSQNAASCLSSAASGTVNSQPATPAAPIVFITQPSCTVSSGIVSVTSDTINVLFSLNGGAFAVYPSGGFILASGTYNLAVQNAAGCTSSITTIVVQAQPATPEIPSISIAQPTCAVATGLVTVTSATAGVIFSVDAGPFGPYPVGGYIFNAGTHTLSSQNVFGCKSTALNFSINVQPVTPDAPSVSIIQPNCTAANALVTVTSDTTALTFSLNGAAALQYPASGYSLLPGTYTLTAQNSFGCISTQANLVVNAQPGIPAGFLSASAIGCNGGTTTLIVIASGGTAPYKYSLDAGVTYQIANSFTVPAGVYAATIRSSNGCTALTNSLTVSAPDAITALVSQGAVIACNGGSTTLTVTASGGTAPFEYRLNGGSFQTNNFFTVGAGTHTITVRDANLCLKVANVVTTNQPPLLSTIISALRITTCGGTTTVIVSASGGTPPYINTGTFLRKAGVYSFNIRDANGCTAVATLDIEAAGCMDLRAFPNPANQFVTIDHTIAEDGATMQLYTSHGQRLAQRVVPIGAFTTRIDLRNLPAGNYIAVFQNGTDRKSILFEKVN